MLRRPGWAVLLWAFLVGLDSLARAAEGQGEAERLYRQYEGLNTPENLGREFIGGEPPRFVQEQIRLLQDIAARPLQEAEPIIVRIADEYLKRVAELGAERLRRSPLLALQIPVVRLLATHVASDPVRARLESLASSPAIKEYARGRALGALTEHKLKGVAANDDAAGAKRGTIILDGLVGDMPLPALLHAPARQWAVAQLASSVAGGEPAAVKQALAPAASTEARRYAADYAVAFACVQKQRAANALPEADKSLLLEVAREWLEKHRPIVAKEKYASDLLGDAVIALAQSEGYEALARLLRERGVGPVERPAREPGKQR